jgi:hypothetical protein
VERQDKVIRDLEKRLDEIEGTSPKATPPVSAPAEPQNRTGMPESAEEIEARMYPNTQQSPVENRGTFEDRQEAAARPGDLVLDPQ